MALRYNSGQNMKVGDTFIVVLGEIGDMLVVVLGEIGDMFVVVLGHNSSQIMKVGEVLGHYSSQIMKIGVVLSNDSSQIMEAGNVFVVLWGQVLMTNSKLFDFLLVNPLSRLQAVLKTSPMDHGSAES